MIQKISRRTGRSESGFTLIELLVVIVILGVLAAVVVFAVQGTGDKGRLAAANTDESTLRTAQEAHCAAFGTYAANDRQLVAAGLLSEQSSMHEVAVTAGGPCGGTSLVIACNPTDATCGPAPQGDGTVPDGSLGPEGTPSGSWTDAPDLPEAADAESVNLPNGKVLFMGFGIAPTGSPNPGPPYIAAVYDPSANTWKSAPMPTPNRGAQRTPADMVVLEGTSAECGLHCGKVFVRIFDITNGDGSFAGVHWKLFDPVAFDAGASGWTNIPDGPFIMPNSAFTTGELVQLRCSRATGPHCGKVLIAGGGDDWAGFRPGGGETVVHTSRRAFLFDATADVTTTAVWSRAADLANRYQSGYRVVGLPDGRALIWGAISSTSVTFPGLSTLGASETFNPGTGLWSLTANKYNDHILCTRSVSTNGTYNFLGGFSTVLPGGAKVLVAGGAGGGCSNVAQNPVPFVSTTDSQQKTILFDVVTNTWEPPLPGLCGCRFGRTVTLPAAYGNKVLLINGGAITSGFRTSSLFDPAALPSGNPWGDAASARTPDFGGTSNAAVVKASVSLLPSGKVLVAGGRIGSGPLLDDAFFYTPPVPRIS